MTDAEKMAKKENGGITRGVYFGIAVIILLGILLCSFMPFVWSAWRGG